MVSGLFPDTSKMIEDNQSFSNSSYIDTISRIWLTNKRRVILSLSNQRGDPVYRVFQWPGPSCGGIPHKVDFTLGISLLTKYGRGHPEMEKVNATSDLFRIKKCTQLIEL